MSELNLVEQRKAYRVRHDLKFRRVNVASVSRISRSMLRIVLHGDDLSDFKSAGFDDHVKVFFPDEVTGQIAVPTMGEQGLQFPEGKKPVMRDYTPRAFDLSAKTLTIDFAIHDAGPVTTWAQQAKVGDQLALGGPRGSMVIPLAFDAYVFFGDDTALPAIARRLEELPAHAKALVVAEVDSAQDQIELHSAARLDVVWLHRSGTPAGEATLFLDALTRLQWPEGDSHTWIAAETSVARQLRKKLVEQYQLEKDWIKAAGYWQHGETAKHATINED